MYLLFGARRLDGIGKSGGEKKKESTAKGFSSLDKRRTKGLCLFRYSVICTVQKKHRVGREEQLKQVWTKSDLKNPMDVLYKPYSIADITSVQQKQTRREKHRRTKLAPLVWLSWRKPGGMVFFAHSVSSKRKTYGCFPDIQNVPYR